MNATNETTTRGGQAWEAYRQTAAKVQHLIALLESRLADHRVRARAHRDEWLYDGDLRQLAQRLEEAIEVLGD